MSEWWDRSKPPPLLLYPLAQILKRRRYVAVPKILEMKPQNLRFRFQDSRNPQILGVELGWNYFERRHLRIFSLYVSHVTYGSEVDQHQGTYCHLYVPSMTLRYDVVRSPNESGKGAER